MIQRVGAAVRVAALIVMLALAFAAAHSVADAAGAGRLRMAVMFDDRHHGQESPMGDPPEPSSPSAASPTASSQAPSPSPAGSPVPGQTIVLPTPPPTVPPPLTPPLAPTPLATPFPSPTPVTLPDVTITPSALPDPTEAIPTAVVSAQPLVPAPPSDGVAPVVAGILIGLFILGGGAVVLLVTLR